MEAYIEGVPCGMLELAPSIGSGDLAGHIALLYLEEEYRSRGLAIQLIGQAHSFYVRLGRNKLRLKVADTNLPAMRLYKKYGFKTICRVRPVWRICVMEKDIC
jgi:ribosomal protein S18 acetylase RimI-like enzyme